MSGNPPGPPFDPEPVIFAELDPASQELRECRLCPWCLEPWPCAGRCYVVVTDKRRAGTLMGAVFAYPDAFEIRQLKPEFRRGNKT